MLKEMSRVPALPLWAQTAGNCPVLLGEFPQIEEVYRLRHTLVDCLLRHADLLSFRTYLLCSYKASSLTRDPADCFNQDCLQAYH